MAADKLALTTQVKMLGNVLTTITVLGSVSLSIYPWTFVGHSDEPRVKMRPLSLCDHDPIQEHRTTLLRRENKENNRDMDVHENRNTLVNFSQHTWINKVLVLY